MSRPRRTALSRYKKTKQGADKHWELGYCLKHAQCPLEDGTKRNLEFLIDIRHEIEHRMTTRIDDHLSAKLQACCLNFNRVLKALFGPQYGLDGELSFALQFSAIDFDQRKALMQAGDLPAHIEAVRASYEEGLTDEQFNDPHYAYRVLFVPKTANRKGQADAVMEFVKPGSEEAEKINRYFFKDVDRPKFRPGIIVEQMNAEGFPRFKIHHHTDLWKAMDAKNPGRGYGVETESDGWRWHERWVDAVRKHCEENRDKYS